MAKEVKPHHGCMPYCAALQFSFIGLWYSRDMPQEMEPYTLH